MAARARPPQRAEDQVQVNVFMPKRDRERFTALCASADLDRSIVIRHIVRELFRAADATDNPLTLLKGVRRVVEGLVAQANEGDEAPEAVAA